MTDSESIVGIYSYKTDPYGDIPSAYFLSYIFDENGILDEELCWKMYKHMDLDQAQRGERSIGPFESMESLNQYIYNVCQELVAEQACLLPVNDFNKVMEEQVGDTSKIFQLFLERGNCMVNIDRKNNRGFMNKIFRS